MSAATDKYREVFASLLPEGQAWLAKAIPDTNIYNLLNALAGGINTFDCRVEDLIDEMFPQSEAETLSEWESEYGLPDPCSGPLATTAERKAAVLAKFAEIGGQYRDYYISIATALGLTIEITEFKYFRAGKGRAGDIIVSEPGALDWQVEITGSETIYFRAGASAAGDSLASNDLLTLIQCIFEKIKPLHTNILWIV